MIRPLACAFVSLLAGCARPEVDECTDRDSRLGNLLEYGLEVHLRNLQNTRLARTLPLQEDPALAELVRLAEIPPYRDPHEAGWLRNQFYEPPKPGWSSFQIYLWAKEHGTDWPNGKRIKSLLARIDASPAAKVGGDNVCHYGCQ